VLVNNDGGGIFSFLPQSETADDNFEMLFGTPHGLDFRPFVEGYGGHFVSVRDWPAFNRAIADGLARGGLNVVEVPTNRGHNVVQHRQVWRAVSQAVSPLSVT
jgi:2-succinyl-5-enolpyruvyl-6-hydroxy-3-cyclohexene-1-carboxylate synthase